MNFLDFLRSPSFRGRARLDDWAQPLNYNKFSAVLNLEIIRKIILEILECANFREKETFSVWFEAFQQLWKYFIILPKIWIKSGLYLNQKLRLFSHKSLKPLKYCVYFPLFIDILNKNKPSFTYCNKFSNIKLVLWLVTF